MRVSHPYPNGTRDTRRISQALRLASLLIASVLGFAIASSIGSPPPATAQDRFALEVPGQPQTRSTVLLDRDGLTIIDAAGERHRYERRPEHDTNNGQWLGYYSMTARRFLRWPRDGRGKMQIGTGAGNSVQWTTSRMEARAIGGEPLRPERLRPDRPRPDDELQEHLDDPTDGNLAAARESGPLTHATAEDGRLIVGFVDARGQLQLYEADGDEWHPWKEEFSERMVPSAAVSLVVRGGELRPRVWTIGPRGDLREWAGGNRWRSFALPSEGEFLPGSSLLAVSDVEGIGIATIDAAGRLWYGYPERNRWQAFESREGLLRPGSSLGILRTPEPRLLVVDRRGSLLEYRLTERPGRAPRRWGTGFPPGAPMATWEASDGGVPGSAWRVALVHDSGHLHHWEGDDARSGERRVLRDVRLPPGAPVTIAGRGEHIVISAVAADGKWLAWTYGGPDVVREVILDGFWGGGPVVAPASGRFFCALDRTGRLVAAARRRGAWESVLLTRQYLIAPRLVRRQITAEPLLPPAEVLFQNRHDEELVVRLFDRTRPEVPQEVVIPPGKATKVRLERDSGAVLEEVFLVPVPGGGVREEIRQIRIPPTSRYTANVWVNRVTSVYFDRTTNKGPEPDEVNRSLVSLGVFPLPPGEELRDGDRIHVYREATARRNPGEVRLLEPNPEP